MRSPSLTALFVLAALAGASPARADDPAPSNPIPDYLTDPKACALLVGGGGQVFDDEGSNKFLFTINSAVTAALFEGLTKSGFRVEKLVLPATDPPVERKAAISAELAARRCGKLLQIASVVEGPADARRFGFQVTVFGFSTEGTVATEGGRLYTTKALFEKKYLYPLDEKTLDALSPEDIANAMGPDLVNARVLARAAAGT